MGTVGTKIGRKSKKKKTKSIGIIGIKTGRSENKKTSSGKTNGKNRKKKVNKNVTAIEISTVMGMKIPKKIADSGAVLIHHQTQVGMEAVAQAAQLAVVKMEALQVAIHQVAVPEVEMPEVPVAPDLISALLQGLNSLLIDKKMV